MRSPRIVLIWLVFGVTAAAASVASAQAPNLSNIRVSNGLEDWYVAQGAFNANEPVAVYVEFATDTHAGFTYSGICVATLSATGHQLGEVTVPSAYIQPGVAVVRSDAFTMTWPGAEVTITCVPDYNPAQAFSVRFDSALFIQSGNVPPLPADVVVEPEPAPDGEAICRSAVLAQGWAPSSLDNCAGVDGTCAVELMEGGWAPSSLPDCRGVNADCAVVLLQSGWAPSSLSNCIDVEVACARELIERGWAPSSLPDCRNVDADCALEVLRQGYAPSSLSNCRF